MQTLEEAIAARELFVRVDAGARDLVLNVLRNHGLDKVAEYLVSALAEHVHAQAERERQAAAPDPAEAANTAAALDELERRPVAVQLVEMATERWRFIADETGDVRAVSHGPAPGRALPLRGKGSMRAVLVADWTRARGEPPSDTAVRRAVEIVEGEALDGPREPLPPWKQPAPVWSEADVAAVFDDVAEETGGELLAEVERFVRRFVAFPSEAAAVASTLWAAHTHAVEAFDSTPRLAPISPEPQCGKTRLLEVLELLCRRPRHVMNSTVAYLFRVVELERPTVLFDEVDTLFGPKADRANEDLRGLLNAGHRRGATVGRMVGEGAAMVPKEFEVYAPAALAGIGDLPPTLMSRSIVLRMRRRAPDEEVTPFRRRDVEAEAGPLQRRLAAWGQRHVEELAVARPSMPAGVVDRPADTWEPLLAIADAVGGCWPKRAREACSTLVAAQADTGATVGAQLLAAIRTVFDGLSTDRLWSEDLCKYLNKDEEAGFGGWNDGQGMGPRDLARQLARFDVRPKDVRQGDANRKGYVRADFREAWTRYLPSNKALQPLQPLQGRSDGESAAEGCPLQSATSATGGGGAVALVALCSGRGWDRYTGPDQGRSACSACSGRPGVVACRTGRRRRLRPRRHRRRGGVMATRKSEVRDLVAFARARGWPVRKTTAGWRLLVPGGGSVVVHETPSCHRWRRNTLRDLRRAGEAGEQLVLELDGRAA